MYVNRIILCGILLLCWCVDFACSSTTPTTNLCPPQQSSSHPDWRAFQTAATNTKKAKKVIGIEAVPEAIKDAKANAAQNKIANADFFVGDMNIYKKLLKEPNFTVAGMLEITLF